MAATFKRIFRQDLTKPLQIYYNLELVFSKDNLANEIQIELYNGSDVYSGGGSVSGTAIRADGRTVPLENGTISGNVVTVALTEACMEIPGTLQVYVKLTSGDVKTTIFAGVFTAIRTETGTVIDPGTIIPSITELINQIDAAIDSIPADYSTLLGSVAGTYSASKTYAVGDYAWYNGSLYRCTTAISTAEAWTSGHWTEAVLGDDVSVLKSAITELTGVDETFIPTWTTSKRLVENGGVINSGALFAYSDKIYIVEAEEQKAYGLHSGSAFDMPSLHFYNSSDEHIGYAYVDGTVDLSTYITQYSPAYIRVSHYATDSYPFNGVSVKFKTVGSVTGIESDITTIQGDITSLDGRTDDLEDDVETLEAAVNMAVVTSKKTPYNLLNGVGVTLNKRWQANASAPEDTDGFTMTDLIPVESSKLYAFVSDDTRGLGTAVYYAQFAADKSIILQSGNGYAETVLTGENTKYVTISYATAQAEKHPKFAKAPFTGDLSNLDDEITDTFKAVSADEISFKGKNQQFENLLASHRNSLVKGYNITNGTMTVNANWMVLTDYIPCEPSTTYNGAITVQTTYNPVFAITWYTEDGVYISNASHANNTVFTSPATAAFFRIAAIQKGTSYPDAEEDFSRTFFAETDIAYGPPCIDPHNVFTGIYPSSSLYGKKWVAFGDSITEKNVRATINYHDYIRAETGITVINKGLGGAGYKCRWQNDNNMFALADAFDFTGVDVVTCMAGINDSWSDLSSNMGDADDEYDTTATAQNQSVMACFNHFLDVVIASAPFAKIGIISPLPCWTTNGSTNYHFKPDDDTSVLAVFIEKCKTACRNRGIPYLDLFHTSGLRPWDSTFNSTMFKCNASDSPDGLHPNYLGHKFFYPLVREFIKKLI